MRKLILLIVATLLLAVCSHSARAQFTTTSHSGITWDRWRVTGSVASDMGFGTGLQDSTRYASYNSSFRAGYFGLNKGTIINTPANRGAIPNPLQGMLAYDTTAKAFYGYNGLSWVRFDSTGGGGTDTAAIYYQLGLRVKYTDTAAMLANYARESVLADTAAAIRADFPTEVDTTSLSNRINLKLNSADTANLSARINLKLNTSDTTAMLAPYYRTAGFGLIGSGHTVYADSTKLATQHDISQFGVYNFGYGLITGAGVGVTNVYADTTQLATQYDLTQIPAEGFDATLAAGNTATDKTAIVNLTTASAGFKVQASGTDIVTIARGSGSAGRVTVTNAAGSSTSFLSPATLSLNSVALTAGNAGTIAVTSDITTPTLDDVTTAGATTSNSITVGGVTASFVKPQTIQLTNSNNAFTNLLYSPGISGFSKTTTFPNASGTVVLEDNTATLTNKSIAGSQLTGSYTSAGMALNSGTLLGRTTALTGVVEEITPNATLTFASTALGLNLSNANTWLAAQTFNPIILTGQASPTYSAGKLVYDTDNESLTFYNNDANVSLQVGQEEWIRVRNVSGSTIANGVPVYISGANSGLPTIAPANANAAATTVCVGLTTESITNNTNGYVTCIGLVRNVNTSAFAAGSTVYVGTSAGTLTNTPPTSPNYRMRVGMVGTSSASTGTIHVTPSTAALGNGKVNQVSSIGTGGTQEYHSAGGDRIVGVYTGSFNGLATGTTVAFTTDADKGRYVIETIKIIPTTVTGAPAGTLTGSVQVAGVSYGTISTSAANTVVERQSRITPLNSVATVPPSTAVNVVITAALTTATVVTFRCDITGYYQTN